MLLFQRLKNWLGYENISSKDLNAEFNNIFGKLGADTVSGANSTNGSQPSVPAMQAMEFPGAVGSEVLSTTIQEDVKQLRYQINQIIGSAQWYSPPATNLQAVGSALTGLVGISQSRVVSGRKTAANQPAYLVPDGSAFKAYLRATSVPFVAYFNNTIETFSADITLTGLSAGGTGPANTALVNDATLVGQASTKTQGERDTQIAIGTVGANILALDGKIAGFKVVDGPNTEYFIGVVDVPNSVIRHCFRGFYFNSVDSNVGRVVLNNGDTVTLVKLAWLFATFNSSTPGMDVTYNAPVIASVQPSGPSTGDYWYDLVNNTWKKFNGTAFVSQTACAIGVTIQDNVACVGARSIDFANPFSALNTISVEFLSNTQIRSKNLFPKINSYGNFYSFDWSAQLIWDTAINLDSGVTINPSSTYYFYVADTGALFISDQAPYYRQTDLLGDYHPFKPWRCVGTAMTDGSSHFIPSSVVVEETDPTAGIPAGMAMDFAGTVAPAGFLGQDGSSYSIYTYPKLFANIGYTHGGAAGVFNVPDSRRRVSMGAGGAGTGVIGNAVGNTGGEEAHTLTVGELASHSHSMSHGHGITDSGHHHTVEMFESGGANQFVTADSNGVSTGNAQQTRDSTTGISVNSFIGNTGGAGSGTAHNIIQPSIIFTKIIKY